MTTGRRRWARGAAFALLVGGSILLPSRAADAELDSLEHLLSVVPADVPLRDGSVMAYSTSPYADLEDRDMDPSAHDPLTRFAVSPPELFDVWFETRSGDGDLVDKVGFDFSDVEATLTWGAPPDAVIAIDLEAAAAVLERLGSALTDGGFDTVDRLGRPVWWRLDDDAVDFSSADYAHPFISGLGMSARVALVGDVVAFARNWPVMDGILATVGDGTDSFAEDPRARALVAALGGEGELIQAIVTEEMWAPEHLAGEMLLPDATDKDREVLLNRLTPADPNPPYLLMGIADMQTRMGAQAVVVLVYPDRATAESVSGRLVELLTGGESLVARRPRSEFLPFLVQTEVVDGPDGLSMATARLSDSGGDQPPGMAFRRLTDMFLTRDLPVMFVSP